jgi:hypothetical protein
MPTPQHHVQQAVSRTQLLYKSNSTGTSNKAGGECNERDTVYFVVVKLQNILYKIHQEMMASVPQSCRSTFLYDQLSRNSSYFPHLNSINTGRNKRKMIILILILSTPTPTTVPGTA